MCAECHTTSLRKGYDLARDSYATTWAALAVDCQACHGPGEAHVRSALGQTEGGRTDRVIERLPADFTRGDWRFEVDACARCHSRRVRLSSEERPGRPLLDEFRPERLRADLYFPDGQQLGEV